MVKFILILFMIAIFLLLLSQYVRRIVGRKMDKIEIEIQQLEYFIEYLDKYKYDHGNNFNIIYDVRCDIYQLNEFYKKYCVMYYEMSIIHI